jgi:hypothetical protein
MLILPLFWVLLFFTIAGYVGNRIMKKKTNSAGAGG